MSEAQKAHSHIGDPMTNQRKGTADAMSVEQARDALVSFIGVFLPSKDQDRYWPDAQEHIDALIASVRAEQQQEIERLKVEVRNLNQVANLLPRIRDARDDQFERAEAAEQEITRQGWQPIETAPKDGTPLIVFADVVGLRVIGKAHFERFADGSEGWIGSSFYAYNASGWTTFGGGHITHWMPLPAPPKEKP